MTNVLQVTITVFRFSFSFLLLKRIDLKIDDMANRLHVYKNKRWGNRERETWHFHVETYTVSQHGLNSKLVWSMSNNMYLFGVHTCLVKTHAKHIHTNSFSKSQCLLHQLTHFVNFLKHVWESKRTIQCTYKDHYHPLIIVIIFIAFVVCCCCVLFLLLLCSFDRAIWIQSVWHSLRGTVGAICVCSIQCVCISHFNQFKYDLLIIAAIK